MPLGPTNVVVSGHFDPRISGYGQSGQGNRHGAWLEPEHCPHLLGQDQGKAWRVHPSAGGRTLCPEPIDYVFFALAQCKSERGTGP